MSARRKQKEYAVPSNNAVFCFSPLNDGKNKTVSADQWNVLALSNGVRNVSEIARALNLDEFKVVEAVSQLVRARLMKQVDEQTKTPVKKLSDWVRVGRRLPVGIGRNIYGG